MNTDYHAKYAVFELTRRHSSADLGKLTASLKDAQVDLNPHQNGLLEELEARMKQQVRHNILFSIRWELQ